MLREGLDAVRRTLVSARVPWLEIATDEPLQINLDGEPITDTHFRFEIASTAAADEAAARLSVIGRSESTEAAAGSARHDDMKKSITCPRCIFVRSASVDGAGMHRSSQVRVESLIATCRTCQIIASLGGVAANRSCPVPDELVSQVAAFTWKTMAATLAGRSVAAWGPNDTSGDDVNDNSSLYLPGASDRVPFSGQLNHISRKCACGELLGDSAVTVV